MCSKLLVILLIVKVKMFTLLLDIAPCTVCFIIVQCCNSRWISEVGLISYRNAESKALANINTADQCCDPPPTAGACRNECDTYFTFCLQSVSERGLGSCMYGRYETTEVGGDELSFRRGRGATLDSTATPNPLVFTGDQWPNDVSTKIIKIGVGNQKLAGSHTHWFQLLILTLTGLQLL